MTQGDLVDQLGQDCLVDHLRQAHLLVLVDLRDLVVLHHLDHLFHHVVQLALSHQHRLVAPRYTVHVNYMKLDKDFQSG